MSATERWVVIGELGGLLGSVDIVERRLIFRASSEPFSTWVEPVSMVLIDKSEVLIDVRCGWGEEPDLIDELGKS